jgi:8-oxo-dGTP diphosphatase
MDKLAIKKVHLAVRAIIPDSHGKILILKRANTSYCNGFWNLPGGKVGFCETAVQALAKEISEETSLVLENSVFLFYMDNLPNENTDLHFVTLFFQCKCSEDVKVNDESSEYKWIGGEEIKLLDFAFDHDKAILDYNNLRQKSSQ